MFLGVNGFEIPGNSYSSSAHTYAVEDSCVSCHLARAEGRYSASPEIGGHSFSVTGEVHGATKVNAAACSACHEDVGADATGEFFNVAAKADYDGDGTVESAQAEGLLHRIVNSKARECFRIRILRSTDRTEAGTAPADSSSRSRL